MHLAKHAPGLACVQAPMAVKSAITSLPLRMAHTILPAQEQLHSCKAAHALRENLNEEREAVFDFLFSMGHEVTCLKKAAASLQG